MAPLSPLSEIFSKGFRQSCTVYRYAGADVTGQPVYHQGVVYPCRVAPRTKRHMSNDGDYTGNTATVFLLPADCPIQAHDRIDLPEPYQRGAVIDEVTTGVDWLGRVTHKVVRIV